MELRKKNYMVWLEDNWGVYVGQPSDDTHCPIATFYVSQFGADWASVDGVDVRYQKNNRVYTKPLPIWATKFVDYIDTVYYYRKSVNGREAFRAIEEI